MAASSGDATPSERTEFLKRSEMLEVLPRTLDDVRAGSGWLLADPAAKARGRVGQPGTRDEAPTRM